MLLRSMIHMDRKDLMPVGLLPDRYALGKSVIYKRRKALGISAKKLGGKAYISEEQLALLDALHEFIRKGGNTAEFLYFRGLDGDED